jgi:hypothetical protein
MLKDRRVRCASEPSLEVQLMRSLANRVALFGLCIFSASPMLAGTIIASTNETEFYPQINQNTCTNCHENDGANPPCAFRPYGAALQGAIGDSCGNGIFSSVPQIRQAIAQVQDDFMPKLLSNALDLPGTDDAASLPVDPGRALGGAPSQIVAFNASSSDAIGAGLAGSSSVDLSFSGISRLERGNRRRSNRPFSVRLIMRNADGFQATTGPNILVNTATIRFANIPPVAADDGFETTGDPSVTLVENVFQQGIDFDPDSTEIRAEPFGASLPPEDGTVALEPDGQFRYTPPSPPSATGREVSFMYRVVDSEGAPSPPATVRINLLGFEPANRPPRARNDRFVMDEDALLISNFMGPEGGGADFDRDPGDTLRLSVVTRMPTGARFFRTGPDGGFRYRPKPDATGVDSFEYQITDGKATAKAQVTIRIRRRNDPPVAGRITMPPINDSSPVQSYDLLKSPEVGDVDEGDRLRVVPGSVELAISPRPLRDLRVRPSRSGNVLSFDPRDLRELDETQTATLTFTYLVRDQAGATARGSLVVLVDGTPNGLGRVAGKYADTLAGRYNNHFLPSAAANGSCHSCHKVGHVGDTVANECPRDIMTAYGHALCVLRGDAPPLEDLRRRLRLVEPDFAPRLNPVDTITIGTSVRRGDRVGRRLTVATPGQTVHGRPAKIHSFEFMVNDDGDLDEVDPSGQFEITPKGQIRVASARVRPGRYILHVRPINDAGQLTSDGKPRASPGFYPIQPGLVNSVTVEVVDDAPIAVADEVNAASGETTVIEVAANDRGGRPSSLSIASPPENGSAAAGGRSISYRSEQGFAGPDRLRYRGANAAGESEAAVTVNVVPWGGAVARDDMAATTVDRPTSVDVLANDGGTGLAARIVAPPASGHARVTARNRIAFAPEAGFVGRVTIGYEARNAVAASAAVLTIEVADAGADLLALGTRDPELRKVARALGDTCQRIRRRGDRSADADDLLAICGDLAADVTAGSGIDAALAAIRNEEALAVVDQIMIFARGAGATLRRRLDRLRGGDLGRGFDASSLSLRIGEQSLSAPALGAAAAPGTRWGVFVAGEAGFGSADGTDREEGSDLTGVNISAGADYRLSADAIAGLALSYARAETDFDGGGSLEGSSWQIAGYGIYDGFAARGLSLSGLVIYGFDSYDQTRAIDFEVDGAAFARNARADYSGSHLNLVAQLDYQLPLAPDSAMPGMLDLFAGADYLVGWVDSYRETGAGGLDLRVEEQRHESLILNAGAEVTRAVPVSFGLLVPSATLALNAELLDGTRSLTSSFAVDDRATFSVEEDGEQGFFATVEVGSLLLTGQAEFELRLSTDVGRESMNMHRVMAGFYSPLSANETLGLGVAASRGGTGGIEAAIDYRLSF